MLPSTVGKSNIDQVKLFEKTLICLILLVQIPTQNSASIACAKSRFARWRIPGSISSFIFQSCAPLQNGSVDGALSSRPPMPGRPAVRLDWETRVSIAQSAAKGLAELHKASIGSVAAPVIPSRILLHEAAAPLLRPPDIFELLSPPQVEPLEYSLNN